MKKAKTEETINVDGSTTMRDEQRRNLVNSLFHKRSSSSDVTLECNGGSVKAHRVVLTSSCNYFDAMFESNLKESKTGKIQFPEINADLMEIIIKFLYTGLIEEVDQADDILKQIMTIAHMMQITTLIQFIGGLLIPTINWENYAEFWDLASACDQKAMISSILEFIQKNFAKFEADRSYDVLTFEQMCGLIPSMSGKQTAEKQVQVILQWVGNESDDRKNVMTQLFRLVNLETLTKDCLCQLSKDNRIEACPEIVHNLLTVAANLLSKKSNCRYCYGY